MPRFTWVLSSLVLGLLLTGCTAGSDVSAPSTSSDESATEYLYVQEAKTASISAGTGEFFTLELSGVGDNTMYFADRPQKDAGNLSTEMFISSFSWSPTPPNAALVIRGSNADDDTIAISLGEPDYDEGAGTLTYQIQPLDGVADTGLASFAERLSEFSAQVFTEVSLFIDDGTTGGCGAGAIASDAEITLGDGTSVPAGTVKAGSTVMGGNGSTSKVLDVESAPAPPGVVKLTFANGSAVVVEGSTCMSTPSGLRSARELEPGSSVYGLGGPSVLETTVSIDARTTLVKISVSSAQPMSTIYVNGILVGLAD